jgi:hypothetical protein
MKTGGFFSNCRSLLAGDSKSCAAAKLELRLQAGFYIDESEFLRPAGTRALHPDDA